MGSTRIRTQAPAPLVFVTAFLLAAIPAAAEESAAPPADPNGCTTGCHEEVQTQDTDHRRFSCVKCHPNVTDGKADHAGAMDEIDGQATCALGGCHEEQGRQVPAGTHKDSACESCHGYIHDEFKGKDLSGCKQCHKEQVLALQSSIHAKNDKGEVVDCLDCHGDIHQPRSHKDPYSPMSKILQVTTCGECHDGAYVRAFRSSVHGEGLLRSGLAVAPTCSTCHGAHDIAAVKSAQSRLSHDNVTETCGECHEFIVQRWKTSAHGKALEKEMEESAGKNAVAGAGDAVAGADAKAQVKTADGKPTKGPVCTTCHPGHETFDPRIFGNHLKMADRCGECHESQAATYRESFHGKATKLGYEVAATCADCHTPHEMLPASDTQSSVHPANLERTCGECHEDMNASFARFEPHLDPTEPEQNNVVHWIWLFMTALLVGTLGFFAVHTLLWLQRSVVAALRGEFPKHHEGEIWIRRFRPVHMWVHVAIIVTFLALAATGLPIKFGAEEWAKSLEAVLGGVRVSRFLHRVAGVLTFGYGAVFLGYLVREIVFRGRRELLFGWKSMTPRGKDLADLWGNLKWFLYLGPRPRFDRWAYWEKFDFFAVFWGVPVIGLSGLVLWFPAFFTQFLPGIALNVAYLVHSDEALLATGFIFFFHFFHTHLRPEAFPLDPVMFLGRMPLERFKDERPEEYERLVASGELAALHAPPPTADERTRAYRFGWIAFSIGLVLGVLLIITGLGAVFR